jgi:hypothetical protein
MNKTEFSVKAGQLLHAIQSGVAFEHSLGSRDGEPKHLRVGVNNALVEIGAIAKLLIDKGIVKEEEVFQYIVEGLEMEVKSYESRLPPGVTLL